MKLKIFFLLFLSFCKPIFSHDTSLEPLLEVLRICEINHDSTLDDIVAKTQNAWVQSRERWQFDKRYEEKRDQIVEQLQKMSLLQAIPSPIQHFDYAVVHGALYQRVCSRFSYLVEQWKKGVRFNQIIFLSGNRPLDAEKEKELLLRGITTEFEMAKMVYLETDLPEGMCDVDVKFVYTPLKENGKRPSTPDTVHEWLLSNPTPGSILAVSNQPYVIYQHAVMQQLLPSGFLLMTIGDQASKNLPVSVHLDNLAKYLYEVKKAKKSLEFCPHF